MFNGTKNHKLVIFTPAGDLDPEATLNELVSRINKHIASQLEQGWKMTIVKPQNPYVFVLYELATS